MIVVFLQLVPVSFQFFQLLASLFQRSLFLLGGRFGNLFQRTAQFSRHFSQHGWSEGDFLMAFRGFLLGDGIVYLS